MKTARFILLALTLLTLAGCANDTKTADIPVRLGMTRKTLRDLYGEPLRIEHPGTEAETWYYNFKSWNFSPASSTGATDDFGDRSSYITAGVAGSKETGEQPIHLSSDGYVIAPLPHGKILTK